MVLFLLMEDCIKREIENGKDSKCQTCGNFMILCAKGHSILNI